jgi:hypothetical protein
MPELSLRLAFAIGDWRLAIGDSPKAQSALRSHVARIAVLGIEHRADWQSAIRQTGGLRYARTETGLPAWSMAT